MATAELPLRQCKLSSDTDEKMPAALLDQYRKIRRILNKATTVDAARRYQMAVLIRQVRDGEGRRYGLQAVKKVAKSLGYSEESLRMYAFVPDAWKESDFRGLLVRKTERGRALSWSHFVQIAQETSVQKRKEYIERVIADNLSVRDLKRIIGGEAEKPASNAAEVPSTLRAGVLRLTATAQATVGSAQLWKTAVFDRLRGTAAGKIDQKLRDDLQRAYEAQVAAEDACHATRMELEEVIHKVGGRTMSAGQARAEVAKEGGKSRVR